MLGYSQIISARAFKEPRVRRKISMIQHLVRQQTHSIWITCTLPCTKNVSLRKYVILFRSPELVCHHNFNLMHTSDCKEFLTFQRLNLIFSIWCRWKISTKEKAGWRCRGITWENRESVSLTSIPSTTFHQSACRAFHERQKPRQYLKLCCY